MVTARLWPSFQERNQFSLVILNHFPKWMSTFHSPEHIVNATKQLTLGSSSLMQSGRTCAKWAETRAQRFFVFQWKKSTWKSDCTSPFFIFPYIVWQVESNRGEVWYILRGRGLVWIAAVYFNVVKGKTSKWNKLIPTDEQSIRPDR